MTNVAELIKKLLALSKSSNEHEAALAMAKAQELLIKHNLDMAQIKDTPEYDSQEESLINEVVDFDKYETWERHLLTCLANRNFCKSIKCDDDIHILGRKANVRSVVTMYNWLEPQIIHLIKESGYKRADKNSYAYGIINTVALKLDQSKESFQAANPSSRAVILNVQSEIDNYFHVIYPHTTKSRTTLHYDAYAHGKADGHKVSIYDSHSQVSHGRPLLA